MFDSSNAAYRLFAVEREDIVCGGFSVTASAQ
jgi:hypothetical protein